MISTHHTDFLIVGAGVLGLTFAYQLKNKHPGASIIILEKEETIGLHASGRNSGVLHSGIYYKEGTLKAKLSAQGAKLMRNFCEHHQLDCRVIGKVILPTHERDDASLDVLYQRAKTNQVEVNMINRAELKEIEPEANSVSGRALYLPGTSIINSKQILKKLIELLQNQGVDIIYNCAPQKINHELHLVEGQQHRFFYKKLINTAGVYADKIASMSGLKHDYCMMPFRGVYAEIVGDIANRIRHLIYPVPNLSMPFLGVHTTTSTDGHVYLGPTAMPSFGRENYKGLKNSNAGESLITIKSIMGMYMKNTQGMRHHVHAELQTLLSRRSLLKKAKALIPNLTLENIQACQKRGIRAQLYNTEKQCLEMDFIVKQHGDSLHILNAISPAFTSSFAFVNYLIEDEDL
jgi:L-2-hydroxyglutarate oxidase